MIRSCRKALRALRTGVVGVRWHWKGAGDEPNMPERENFFFVSEEAEDEDEEEEEESKLLEDWRGCGFGRSGCCCCCCG